MQKSHETYQVGTIIGVGFKARRYLNPCRNKQAEARMLNNREFARDQWTNTQLDTEAFYCSLMMMDSWERERVKL